MRETLPRGSGSDMAGGARHIGSWGWSRAEPTTTRAMMFGGHSAVPSSSIAGSTTCAPAIRDGTGAIGLLRSQRGEG